MKFHTGWRPKVAWLVVAAAVLLLAATVSGSARADAPATVYVNSAWSSVANGDDPDGTGPATAMGTDAFSNLPDAEAALADHGTMYTKGTFDASDIALNKPFTLDGQGETELDVSAGSSPVNALDITSDDVTVTDVHIVGPAAGTSYLSFSWGSDITRGITVAQGVTGFAITNSVIEGLRNDILIDGRNSTGSVTGNTIDDSKSAISVQYTDGTGLTINDNQDGQYGNEWDLNLHLNGNYDGSTTHSNPYPGGAAPDDVQQHLLDLSSANDGWSVQDQAYTSHNRTVAYVSTSGSSSNQGSPLNQLSTIQAGVDAVVKTATVHVAAGTYAGQVKISKDLNLQGAGTGSTTLQAAASMPSFTINGSAHSPVVAVDGAKVTISNLTVDGNGQGNSNGRFNGIGGSNADLTIDDVSVIHVRNNPLDGVQSGVGIYDYNTDGSSRTVKVENSTIADYQKGGVVLSGSGLTADVENVTVTGAGQTSLTAQNGIQVSYGASGTVTGSTVSGNYCTLANSGDNCTADPAGSDPNADGAAGILLYQAGSVEVGDSTVSNNQYGIWSVGSSSLNIHDNQVSSSGSTSSGVAVWNQDQWSSSATATSGSITGNTLSGMGYGLLIRDYNGSNAPTVTAHGNQITGNTVPAASNTSFDATGNWWGSVSGPGTLTDVTTKPWATDASFNTQSNNADLTNLSLSAGTLNPAFSAGTTDYQASVDNNTSSVSVSCSANPGATVSGCGSSALSVGNNVVAITVTSADASVSKTYNVVVNRASAPSSGGGGNTGGGGTPPPTTTSTPPTVTTSPDGSVTHTAPADQFGVVSVTTPAAAGTNKSESLSVIWGAGTFGTTSDPVAVNCKPIPVGSQSNNSSYRFADQVVSITAELNGNPITQLSAPLEIVFSSPGEGFVPSYSHDGVHFTNIPLLTRPPDLPAGQADGYYVDDNGRYHVLTRHLTIFRLMDGTPPTASKLKIRPTKKWLRASWSASHDNIGVVSYIVYRNGHGYRVSKHTYIPLLLRAGKYVVRARDAAGNLSKPSATVTVVRVRVTRHGKHSTVLQVKKG